MPRAGGELQRGLADVYGQPIELRSKRLGLDAVAAALDRGEIARAQIAALLLQMPDPPLIDRSSLSEVETRRLAQELAASGLSKADDEWDEQHPRTKTAPNPGWFAPKPKPDNGGAADAHPVAYQGDFHDVLVAEEIDQYRRTGAICISEARLSLGASTARIDILCRTKIGGLMGVEVKTGDDLQFTPAQMAVYFHSLLGGFHPPTRKSPCLASRQMRHSRHSRFFWSMHRGLMRSSIILGR